MRPEVTICTRPPYFTAQPQKLVQPAVALPADQAGVRQRSVEEAMHPGHPAGGGLRHAAAGPGAAVPGRPPPAAQGRRADYAHDDLVLVHQPDEGCPDRHPADEIRRRVDRVDDPAALAGSGPAELLAEHRVPWPGP